MKAVMHFDGGCRPTNPGHAGFGVVVYGERHKAHTCSRYIGWKTNNEAEYAGLIVGIKLAHDIGASSIKICTDSQLVMNQVNGEYKTRSAEMKLLCLEARSLLERFFHDDWEITWWKRDNNSVADQLSTQAINYGRNTNPLTPAKLKAKRPGQIVDPFNQDENDVQFPDFIHLMRTRMHTKVK